ncbi:DUF2591 family protein [Citrobacter freundii]
MDYSKMSDFEINKLVAQTVYLGMEVKHPSELAVTVIPADKAGAVVAIGPGFTSRLWVDYCNNPADAWPIIVGNKLSIINADDKWLCVPEDEPVNGVTGDAVHMIYSGDGVEHENPLRAAMIVFLMMQESANVPANSTGSDIR